MSGWPSDHFRSGRSVYVHVLPSAEPFHDSASPGMIEKSFADLSVSVAYCMFHASYAATVTPRSGFMLSIPCAIPTVEDDLLAVVLAFAAAACRRAPASAASAATEPSTNFTPTLLKVCGADHSRSRGVRIVHWTISSIGCIREVPVEEALQPPVEVQLRPGAQQPWASVG